MAETLGNSSKRVSSKDNCNAELPGQVEELMSVMESKLSNLESNVSARRMLLACKVQTEIAEIFSFQVEGKVRIQLFYHLDDFHNPTGFTDIYISRDSEAPHVFGCQALCRELLTAITNDLGCAGEDIFERGSIEICFDDLHRPGSRDQPYRLEKAPDFSIDNIATGSGIPIIWGEVAHEDEDFQDLADELRAVVEGNKEDIKIALGMKVKCLRSCTIDGWEQPQLMLIAVSLSKDDQHTIFHGPKFFSSGSHCLQEGGEAMQLRIDKETMVANTQHAGSFCNSEEPEIVLDLQKVQSLMHRLLKFAPGLETVAQPLDPRWMEEAEKIFQIFAQQCALKRQEDIESANLRVRIQKD